MYIFKITFRSEAQLTYFSKYHQHSSFITQHFLLCYNY